MFKQLTGDLIRWVALRTHCAAGPSSVDAYTWQRLCSSFGSAFVTLCNYLAAVAYQLCVDDVDSAELISGFCGISTYSFGQEAECSSYWHW